jgi:hypothetical protein
VSNTSVSRLVTVICGACAVAVGVVAWIAAPEDAVIGVAMAVLGVGALFIGSLSMWGGRHAPPSSGSPSPGKGRTDLTPLPSIVDGIADLLS